MNHCTADGYTPGLDHLVGVIDNLAHRATLYVDGVAVVDDVELNNMEQDTGQVWMAGPTNSGVHGLIDEVAIWTGAVASRDRALTTVRDRTTSTLTRLLSELTSRD